MLLRSMISMASPAGPGARLSVLIFHRVLQGPDPLMPDEMYAQRFDLLLSWVKAWFRVLPLDSAVRLLAEGRLPSRAAVLTFDDGYADNHDVALPLLQRHGLPCSFFIATGFLDGGRMWNDSLIETVRACAAPELDLRGVKDFDGQDLGRISLADLSARRRAVDHLIGRVKYFEIEQRVICVDQIAERAGVQLPDDLMMTSAQVRALHSAGMLIGAHTVNHPILSRLSEAQGADEIERSRQRLEALIEAPVTLFAYPNGRPGKDYGIKVHPRLVRDLGFDAAVSTHWGAAGQMTDLFQIPRFTPWDRSRFSFGLRMLRQLMQPAPVPAS